MDNDMMPNDGELFNAFQEPQEQAEERRSNLGKAQAAKPMLEDLLALFESDIQQLKSVDSIPEAVMLDVAEFQAAWAINQQLLDYARSKKSYLESLLNTTKR